MGSCESLCLNPRNGRKEDFNTLKTIPEEDEEHWTEPLSKDPMSNYL